MIYAEADMSPAAILQYDNHYDIRLKTKLRYCTHKF